MISDSQLTDLLTRTGDLTEVPPDGAVGIIRELGSGGSGSRSRSASGSESAPVHTLSPRRRARAGKWVLAAAAAVVLVVFAAAVLPSHHGGSSKSSTTSASGAVTNGVAPVPAGSAAAGSDAGNSLDGGFSTAAGRKAAPLPAAAASSASVSTTTSALSGPRVVVTANVALQVAQGSVPKAMQQLTALVKGSGGYVASSSSSLTGSDPNGSVTLEVPYAAYQALHSELVGGTYGHVLTDQETGQDVTAQYTDLGARLTALQATRASFLTLLSKATTIGDTLAVEQQLTSVQEQIESLQGQQKLLAAESDNATLTVTVSEKNAVLVTPVSRTGFSRAWHNAGSGFNRGLERIIGDLGTLVVVLLVLGVLGLIGWGGWKFGRRLLV